MTAQTFGLLAEYFALQDMIAVMEHEQRTNTTGDERAYGDIIQRLGHVKAQAVLALRHRLIGELTNMDADTIQEFFEFISLQARAAIMDHEHRVHNPSDIMRAAALTRIAAKKFDAMERLRAKMVAA